MQKFGYYPREWPNIGMIPIIYKLVNPQVFGWVVCNDIENMQIRRGVRRLVQGPGQKLRMTWSKFMKVNLEIEMTNRKDLIIECRQPR